ncbi:MAG: GTP cyclohydrolase II RibA [Gammaproteobacteria bacterium]|nr:GTP cyclohydrolase II RibA [Gammaproteobacteria bacterium]
MKSYKIIEKKLSVSLRTIEGFDLKIGAYKICRGNEVEEHAVVYKGSIFNSNKPVLLRINSACYTDDIFHCNRCDCTWQFLESMRIIDQQGGLIIYHFAHEGRGVGFLNKLKTYDTMDKQQKTTKEAFEHEGYDPDYRDFFASVLILKDLGIGRVRLISNNPNKREFLEKHGINVAELVSIVNNHPSLQHYLKSKKEQFGHVIDLGEKQ